LLGAEEQAGIGKRIHDKYAGVFTGQGIDILMTHKVRTQQSAEAFLASFNNYPGKKKYKVVPDSLDNVLRFYDLAPAYLAFKKSKAVQEQVDSLNKDKRTARTAENICLKVFTREFANTLLKDGVTIKDADKPLKVNGRSFAEDLYDLYSVQFSISGEMKQRGYTKDSIDFSIAFNQQDLEWLDFRNGAEDFLEKGAGTDTLGLQVRVAVPLLADYINTTDEIVNKSRKADAIFRFTHAEAISPFATLLGIPSASTPSSSVYRYDKYWKTSSIIPLSANIQWVIFTNGEEYLVKVLLNEKETALPMQTDVFPFYKWKDVKEYYLKKMSKLDIHPQQDMAEYLSGLK
jgi:multiple inositol-polyphosphate phosphatase / 2,3-bisphosphoglycerate 3-phosphatase